MTCPFHEIGARIQHPSMVSWLSLREPSYPRTMILQQNSNNGPTLCQTHRTPDASIKFCEVALRRRHNSMLCFCIRVHSHTSVMEPRDSPHTFWLTSLTTTRSSSSDTHDTHEETRQCHQTWLHQLGVQVVNQLPVQLLFVVDQQIRRLLCAGLDTIHR